MTGSGWGSGPDWQTGSLTASRWSPDCRHDRRGSRTAWPKACRLPVNGRVMRSWGLMGDPLASCRGGAPTRLIRSRRPWPGSIRRCRFRAASSHAALSWSGCGCRCSSRSRQRSRLRRRPRRPPSAASGRTRDLPARFAARTAFRRCRRLGRLRQFRQVRWVRQDRPPQARSRCLSRRRPAIRSKASAAATAPARRPSRDRPAWPHQPFWLHQQRRRMPRLDQSCPASRAGRKLAGPGTRRVVQPAADWPSLARRTARRSRHACLRPAWRHRSRPRHHGPHRLRRSLRRGRSHR